MHDDVAPSLDVHAVRRCAEGGIHQHGGVRWVIELLDLISLRLR